MDADLFSKLLINNYQGLTAGKIAKIVSILNDIPSLTGFKSGDITKLNSWMILGEEFDFTLKQNVGVICLAAGKSRYNPMKWENAFNLKQGLGKLIDCYSENHKHISLGLLLTDVWRPVELYEYAKEIEKFERLGVDTIAILLSGNSITPIRWPWRLYTT
jgi:hypothetical protein